MIADPPYSVCPNDELYPWDNEPLSIKDLLSFIKTVVFNNSATSFSMVIFCNHSMTSAYAQALLGLYKNKGISIMYGAMIREDFFGGGKSWFVNN